MAKLCEGCGFYSADNAPTQCPSCDAALKFTFLPPAGAKAAPLPGLPVDPYADLERKQSAARAGLLGVDWRIVQAVAVALVAVGAMGVRFYFRQEARAEREAQEVSSASGTVKPGMHISVAARILESKSTMPKWRGSIQSDFDEDDDSDGTMEVDNVKITWRDGYVVSVEQTGSGAPGDEDDEADPDADVRMPTPVHPAERVVGSGGGR
jgi:hypothetical protein